MCGIFIPRCEAETSLQSLRSASFILVSFQGCSKAKLKTLQNEYGNICFVFSVSALLTSVSFFSLRMRPGAFVPSKCRLPECERMILPVAVTLKRFAAPRCVFNFLFGFEAFLGIAKSSLHTATPCLESESPNSIDVRLPYEACCAGCCAGFAGAGAPFFGASNATNTLPSMRGIVSICPYSVISPNSRVIFARPTSWCAISRPR